MQEFNEALRELQDKLLQFNKEYAEAIKKLAEATEELTKELLNE